MNGRELRTRLGGAIGLAFRAPTKPAQRREAATGTSPQQIVTTTAAQWQIGAADPPRGASRAPDLELVSVNTRRVEEGAQRRFSDPRSLRQIAIYVAYRSRGGDERNERALARWNRYLREQWELDHLGAPDPGPSGDRSGAAS